MPRTQGSEGFRGQGHTADTEQAQANTLKFAKSLFASFEETGRYRLMLVEDTQKKLDSFG